MFIFSGIYHICSHRDDLTYITNLIKSSLVRNYLSSPRKFPLPFSPVPIACQTHLQPLLQLPYHYYLALPKFKHILRKGFHNFSSDPINQNHLKNPPSTSTKHPTFSNSSQTFSSAVIHPTPPKYPSLQQISWQDPIIYQP